MDGVAQPTAILGSPMAAGVEKSIARAGGYNGLYLSGELDEIAIWDRTLSANEIQSIYERGLRRFNVSVRSCDDASCVSDPWVDLADDSPQVLSVADNQYFQYKFEIETDDLSYTPELYNFTINYDAGDDIPEVFDLIPTAGSSYNIGDAIEVGANVTDDIGVDTVLANITYPNSTSVLITLNQVGATDKYNNSFTIPVLDGNYNVTFIANDTAGQINATETTFFVGNDVEAPTYSSITESPSDPHTYAPPTETYQFEINWQDNIGVNEVWINFDGTDYTPTDLGGGNYRITFNDLEADTYIYTWYANDTAGNQNDTGALSYTVLQATGEIFTYLQGSRANANVNNNTEVNLTASLNSGAGDIQLYVDSDLWNTGPSPLENITFFNEGTYTILGNYTGNENYTADSESWTLTVTNATVIEPSNCATVPDYLRFTQRQDDGKPHVQICYVRSFK